MNARAQFRQAEQQRVDPLTCFIARAEARALLWRCCEFSLHEAVDALQRDVEDSGLADEIGLDAVQKILSSAFRVARHG